MRRASQLLRRLCGDRRQRDGRQGEPFQRRASRRFQRRSGLESLESRLALTVWHVDASSLGSGDGATWESAFGDLQDALAASEHGDEIWIADGIYTPTQGVDRTRSFAIPDGVSLYGGFAGGETTRDERDPNAHVSLLAGRIGVANEPQDNSYHVITVAGTNHVTLDSVVVGQGFANGPSGFEGVGGAIVNLGNLELRDVRIGNNRAANGAGIYNAGVLSIVGGTIEGNQTISGGNGGGIYADAGSTTTLRDVAVFRNSASNRGGGLSVAGAVGLNTMVEVTNSVFANSASTGGGMAIGQNVQATLRHSTLSNFAFGENLATQIETESPIRLLNTIVGINEDDPRAGELSIRGPVDPTSSYNLISAANGDTLALDGALGNIIGSADAPIDPMLRMSWTVDYVETPMGAFGLQYIAARLGAFSPAVDRGDPAFSPSAYTPTLTNDFSGQARSIDGDANGVARIDIGAVESNPLRLLVSTAADENDGNHGAGDLSLREAIMLANASPGDDVIELPAGRYVLSIARPNAEADETDPTVGDLDVLDLTGVTNIVGRNSATTTIDANGIDRVFYAGGRGLAVSGVTIRGGNAAYVWRPYPGIEDHIGGGGGVAVARSFTAVDSIVEQNYAVNLGGGISADENASVELRDTHVRRNSSGEGGGVWIGEDAALVAQGGSFFDNDATTDGGGLYFSESGYVRVDDALIASNVAGDRGGGIFFDSDSAKTDERFERVVIEQNVAGEQGGGVYILGVDDDLTFADSTIAGNRTDDNGEGGGVFIDGSGARFENVEVRANSAGTTAGSGGGFYISENSSFGTGEVPQIVDSVIAANSAPTFGGGILIADGAALSVIGATISGNSAGAAGGGVLTTNLVTPLPVVPNISLNNITIENNTAPFGAGLCNGNNQSVELTNSRILTNTATEQGAGGINDSGYLRLVGTEIRGNRLVSSGAEETTLLGAGFLNRSFGGTATLVLDGVQVVDNQIVAHAASVAEAFGAGLANLADDRAGLAPARAEVFVDLGQVSQNRAEAKTGEGDAIELFARSYGAGIFSTTIGTTASALVSLNRATVDGNTAYATAAVDAPSSDESPHSIGGGVFADGNSSVTVNLSTVSANRADAVLHFADNSYAYGGGIAFASLASGAKLDVLNSTISGNVAEAFSEDDTIASGGGIVIGQPWTSHQPSQATAAVESSTVAFNRAASFGSDKHDVSGGGIAVDSRAYPTAPSTYNSLVAVNCDLARRTADTACSPAAGVAQGIDSLAFNGGPTKTHALLAGSPWIDAGDPAYNAINTADQRGQPRLLDGNGDTIARIDLGGYEYSTTFLFGDLDHNGKVEIPDALFIQRNFSANSATYAQGDLNADGRVDAADVGALVHHLGKRLPSSATASAVVTRAARGSAVAVEAPSITVRRRALAPTAVDEALSGGDWRTTRTETASTAERNSGTTTLRARRRPTTTANNGDNDIEPGRG